MLRIVQAADGCDGLAHVALDLCSKVNVAAMGLEHGGVGDAERLLVRAGRDVDEVDVGLYRLGNAHALLQVVASLAELCAAHAELDREERPHGLAHGLGHLDGQATTVLERSAVLVRPVVEQGREELVDEPAMAAVNHEHLEAGALCKPRHVAVGADDVRDLLLREGANGDAVSADGIRRTPLVKPVLATLVRHVRAGEHAGVRKLQRGDGTVTADGVGGIRGARQGVEDGLVQVVGVAAVRLRVHHALGHGDRTCAALGSKLIERRRLGTDAAVVRDVRATHGRAEHAVPERGPPKGDGLAEVWVLAPHWVSRLHRSYFAVKSCAYHTFGRSASHHYCNRIAKACSPRRTPLSNTMGTRWSTAAAIEGSWASVELAPSVIRHPDAIRAGIDRGNDVLRRLDALHQHGKARHLLDHLDVRGDEVLLGRRVDLADSLAHAIRVAVRGKVGHR